MKMTVKAVLLAVAGVALAGGGFWAGMAYQGAQGPAAFRAPGSGQSMRGGMANLTEEERTQLESMSDEERQAFMQEQFGAAPRSGGPMRGGNLEGEVLEVADDTLTIGLANGGSQTVYTDSDTVMAAVEGVPALASGSRVIVIAEPATDGVTTATVLVVLE